MEENKQKSRFGLAGKQFLKFKALVFHGFLVGILGSKYEEGLVVIRFVVKIVS